MNKVALVGEAWGKDEAAVGLPFVGASGRLLNGMLAQVGIERSECLVTSVFNLQPQPRNDVSNLCGPKENAVFDMPYLIRGKYVDRKYQPELDRLFRELEEFQPNVVVAFGATAAWALLKTSGIRAIRGAPAQSWKGYKVLPTYHPSAVLRDYKLRPIVLADLMKAARESEYPEIIRPMREIWVEPTLDDIRKFKAQFLDTATIISADIETKGETITCIGFSATIDRAIVIPFYDPSKSDFNYWRSFEEEMAAWDLVKQICQLPTKFLFQNGLYDMHFLWRTMGITVPGASDDTMLLHHALQPEMEKGLGFLGTVYTDEASWKFMRKGDTIKKED